MTQMKQIQADNGGSGQGCENRPQQQLLQQALAALSLYTAKLKDLHFCAAVCAGALWPAAGPISPASGCVQYYRGGEGKKQRKEDQKKFFSKADLIAPLHTSHHFF